MSEIEVSVVAGGRIVDTIIRPVRDLHGRPAVTYRKKLWPLRGRQIHIDGINSHEGRAPPGATESAAQHTAATARSASPIQVIDSLHLGPTEEPAKTPECGMTASQAPPEDWDPSQERVINAAASRRIFVGAGPGTGKTAVACKRIAALIERAEVEPVNVWIVSFTRTAVQEIRNRIAAYLGEDAIVSAIRIATLDSHAWAIHSGFDPSAQIKGLHEENIEKVIEAIRGNADVEEYLQSVQLLVVDEAQDVIGVRADLVSALIEKISPSCGVSVFADEAQAIYGFSEDGEEGASGSSVPLLQRLKERDEFVFLELEKVHRTDSENLNRIFTEVRAAVLQPGVDGALKKSSVRHQIETLSDKSGLSARGFDFSILDANSLVLFRRRAEALLTSCFLNEPHRLRLSGLPPCLHSWLAQCFWDYTEPRLGRSDFEEIYRARVPGPHGTPTRPSADAAWQLLFETAGQSAVSVDMRRLRRVLGRRQPPGQFCSAELGSNGPILGTIHASKGREAENVVLFMPAAGANQSESSNDEEEARVVFVGATRARKRLHVGRGYSFTAASLDSGRAYRCKKQAASLVEIGRDGDIQPSGVAGRQIFQSASDVHWAQRRYLDFEWQRLSVIARADSSAKYTYKFIDPVDGRWLGCLSDRVNYDLWDLAKIVAKRINFKRCKPPASIPHLRLVGCRSLVVQPDDPELEKLHEPYATSGFMLAPVILGYSKVYFQW